jgi:Cu(I)/Ag(I) efflux system membrane protein CusA/SilA
MINRVVDLSLRYRHLVLAIYVGLGIWGYVALRQASIDALPDLSDHQVIVFTDWPGHSAQEVEDQVTFPLTVSLQGLAGVRVVRSQSAFGFSMIYAVFEDATDLYFARARVLERLNLVSKSLPAGVVPTLGPDATGVGHIFWYTLESADLSLTDLRALQDWFVRYQLNSVPGVAEVASIGGTVRQYQIDVDPQRLRAYGIPLGDVVRAVADSNANVGGNVVEANGTWSIVRGVGLVESARDLEHVPVRASATGVPVLVKDVADVRLGEAFRTSSLVKGTREAVGGVVVARVGSNPRQVIDAVKARIAEITLGLPAGVTIAPFYDRSELIDRTVATLRIALIEEVLLVTLAHVIFLLHFRSILVVTLPLPLAVLVSFLVMRFAGVTSNLMSLAGIAIAIGVLVDAGIVVTENAFRTLEREGIDTRNRAAVLEAVRRATHLVARPVFFSMTIIVLAFVPVFALTGQEGKLFHPLALTKTVAVMAATVMAVTLVPVLCVTFLRGRMHGEEHNPLMRWLGRLYEPVLNLALRHRVATLAGSAVLLGVALVAGSRVGSEFMPPLDEGDLLFMPIADPSISLAENTSIAARQNAAIMRVPEVAFAVAKVARADTSTDPAPLNMTETIVHLKPRAEWRPGMTLEALRAELSRAAELPGVASIWTMPIINRIDMLSTGIRSEVGVKVFGDNLDTLQGLARRVADAVRTVPGASNVYAEPLTSGQYLNIRVRRDAAARHGLTVGDVQQVVEYGIGETPVGMTIEGRQRFPIRVRFAPPFRADADAIGDAPVLTPSGRQVPLREVADIAPARGPAMISSENGLLVATVLMNVQGRDVGGFVENARAVVAAAVPLPPGYYLGWSGRFENQIHARERLQLVVPAVLVVTFLLLWAAYRSALEAAHVLLAVPFAMTGGLMLVWALGYNFSVAVWVGFIALFGTAVQTAVVMVIYLEEATARKRAAMGGVLTRAAIREAVVEGALLRLRPKVMTVSTVIAGLMPIMWSERAGAEVMKPIAAPVLGGMLSSLAHVLLVTPVIFSLVREREIGRDQTTVAIDSAAEPPPSRRKAAAWMIAIVLIALTPAGIIRWMSQGGGEFLPDETTAGSVLARTVSGDLAIAISSRSGAISTGRQTFFIEFRSVEGNRPIDVGDVQLSATMTMPGMSMSAGVSVQRTSTPGRYEASGDFGMAGAWTMTVEWNGPAGRGSTVLQGDVR